jgi:hypothetical protein
MDEGQTDIRKESFTINACKLKFMNQSVQKRLLPE